MNIEKSCLFCGHFDFDMGEEDYSELTPGSDACFSCFKGHWPTMSNSGPNSLQTFIANIKTAEGCKDFEASHET